MIRKNQYLWTDAACHAVLTRMYISLCIEEQARCSLFTLAFCFDIYIFLADLSETNTMVDGSLCKAH